MIRLADLSIRLGAFVLDDINLQVPAGSYAVLMGRTGCGKTTILEAVCGLRRLAGGRIFLMGEDVTGMPPGRRNVGLVPQDGALFNPMTVAEHLGFALRVRRRPAAEIAARVEELAGWLNLGHLLKRRPFGLSGGERQRVALGRALAAKPHVLCLDEPFSALDEDTRAEMVELLRRIHRQAGVTVLHVTHNRQEAAALAGQLFRLQNGKLIEMEVQ